MPLFYAWTPNSVSFTCLCIHTRITRQKDEIWRETLSGHPIGLVANRPTELSVGRFNASLIRFLNRKFCLLTDWDGYKGKISTPLANMPYRWCIFLLPVLVSTSKVTASRIQGQDMRILHLRSGLISNHINPRFEMRFFTYSMCSHVKCKEQHKFEVNYQRLFTRQHKNLHVSDIHCQNISAK
jgi:hypothetical protein